MRMPKTTMDEHHGVATENDDIRSARKAFHVFSKPITECVQDRPYRLFGLGVLRFVGGHDTAALLFADVIHGGTYILAGKKQGRRTRSVSAFLVLTGNRFKPRRRRSSSAFLIFPMEAIR